MTLTRVSNATRSMVFRLSCPFTALKSESTARLAASMRPFSSMLPLLSNIRTTWVTAPRSSRRVTTSSSVMPLDPGCEMRALTMLSTMSILEISLWSSSFPFS